MSYAAPHTKVLLLAAVLVTSRAAMAYPEFQVYSQEQSGRVVNCSMCHAHPDGPEGLKPGQIGSLSPAELQDLNKARSAFEPGQEVDSPILNEFGNRIVEELGKTKFLELRLEPGGIVTALDEEVDTDGDGIGDVEEYVEGTLPVDSHHGDPWALFWINVQRRWFHILMITIATVLGLFGLNNLLRGFESMTAAEELDEKEG
jgi:hypothetical protein